MLPMIFSSGWPFFSYIASRKKGSMTSIMHIEKRHANQRPAAKAD